MKITKIEELPFEENKTYRVKIAKVEKANIVFTHRTRESETDYKIKIPKNKIWKKSELSIGKKINVKKSISLNKHELILEKG